MTAECAYIEEIPSSFDHLDGWNDEVEGWTCQRQTDDEYCRYHKDEQETDNQDLQELFRTEVTEDTDRSLELVGAKFDYLNLQDITVQRPVYLIETEFNDICITGSELNELVHFQNATFDYCDFSNTTFAEVVFDGEVTIQNGYFTNTHFTNVDFSDTVFHEATFDNATFEQATFKGADILREAQFEDAAFYGTPDFTDASFARPDLSDITLTNANLEDADFTNAILFGADLRGSRIAGARFSGAQLDDGTQILGDPSSDGVEGHEYSLEALLSKERCVYDPRATFGQDARTQLLNRDDEPLTETDLRDRARRVYRTLESLGQQAARPQLQAQSFVRRKNVARRQYKTDANDSDAYSTSERFIAAFRWLRAEASRSIFLYGESPWRILGWSGIFVLVFGIIFAFGGHVTTTQQGIIETSLSALVTAPIEALTAILDAVYYSMLVYTTLGFSTFHMVGFGRALGVFEASLGIIMASLLVFVLGRRAAR